ncbi:MAG: PIN domain-containing protein [Spirochaetaceae bacterium]|jgi:predicted nucleic acid-binding protein|nr:PIN domain-containing protein [Spirochaetaceae bacterium]
MQSTILIDAGPLIALFDRSDRYHRQIVDFLRKDEYRFVSTLAVLTETAYMLGFEVRAQIDFFNWVLSKGVILSDINQNDLPRIITLTEKYADLPMDLADATLVVTAEKSGIREIISVDKDFDIYRLPGRENIHNVFQVAAR